MARKLNAEQLAAINHSEGPLLIIAGAGTGKTTVITERVKRLITEKLALPGEILALTFTEKAAKEMEDRIDTALPYGFTQMWVMTFHSFCDRILRDEGHHIGLNSSYRLITGTDTVSLVRRHLFDFKLDYYRPLGNPNKFIAGMIQHFDRLRDEDVSPKDYQDWVATLDPKAEVAEDQLDVKQYQELSESYQLYQDLKIKENVMDFSDLITYTLKLFRTRPNLLKIYQNKFKYFLVDEYQDTNYSQTQLVNLLASRDSNLTVVADDDQSIYRWRGAAISNVIQFRATYPKAELVVLTQNYRSTQEILDASYQLIQNNNPDRLEVREGINKKLKSALKTKNGPPQFMHFNRVENEADGVAKKIAQLLEDKSQDLTPKDFAILVRANLHAHPFMGALSRMGIPYQFLGPGRLFDRPEVKDLIAYLRVLRDYSDSASLYRVLSMDYFGLSVKDLITLSVHANRSNQSLFAASEKIDEVEIPDESREIIKKVLTMLNRHIELTTTESAGQILFYFLQDSGMLSSILNFKLPIDEHKANNITRFFNKLKSFESGGSDSSVSAVLDWIDLSHEVGESPAASDMDWSENDSVNILTIHSAKGLEFPVVFLVNLVSQRFPTTEKKEQVPIPHELIKEVLPKGDYHLQEERRLFYVGVTRAKKHLFLTAADFYGEGKRAKKLSPFIFETLGSEIDTKPETTIQQPSLLDWNKADTPPGNVTSPKIVIDYLSYSQIQTFLDCPLHYKAKYILKIPSPPSAASSFGNTIHHTMKDYYESLRRQENPDITQIYARNWIPEGYHNATHAQAFFDKGLIYLQDYLKLDPFSGATPVRLEESFTVPLNGLKIGGKIDRVDVLEDGSIEIIDYKTSPRMLTVKEAQTNLQLSFYALAASIIPTPPFNVPPEKIKLTLYYFDQQTKVSVIQTPEILAKARASIETLAHEIEASDFHCSGTMICQGKCDFQALCDLDLGS